MSAVTSIVLADGQATPVNVTFTPLSVANGDVRFVDRSTGIAAFMRSIVAKYSSITATRKTTRTTFQVAVPVTATVDGVLVVVRTLRAEVAYIIPDAATDAERKDLHAFVVNGLGNALIRGNMRDLDPLY